MNISVKKIPISLWFIISALLLISCQEIDPVDKSVEEQPEDQLSNLVPGQYIVTLNSNVINFRMSDTYKDVQAGMRKTANDILERHHVAPENILAVYSHAIQGFALMLSPDEYQKLRKDPRVKSIEQDIYVPESLNFERSLVHGKSTDGSETHNLRNAPPGRDRPKDGGGGDDPETSDPDPGSSDPLPGSNVQSDAPKYLDRIDQRQLPLDGKYSYSPNGTGVTAYIPVGAIWEDPEEFGDRITNENLIGSEEEHQNGVTTNLALTIGGRIFGSSKNIQLVGVRTFDSCCDSEAYLSAQLASYDWILANGVKPAVIVISLVRDLQSSSAYFTALENLYHAGFPLFTSSGGWMEDACTWASSYKPYVFTIGIARINDEKRLTGNYGDCIDLFATGTDGGSNEYTEIYKNFSFNPNFVVVGAAAGVAANYLETNPTASPDQVYEFLRQTSTKNVVKLSNSVNNHLLFNGLTAEGAGISDPSRPSYALDIIGNLITLKGNEYRVDLRWNPLTNAGDYVDIYENGKMIARNSIGDGWNGGRWRSDFIKGRNLAPRNYKVCLSGTSKCSNEVEIVF